jgi:hypothetical protein
MTEHQPAGLHQAAPAETHDPQPLARNDVQALKRADAVTFRHHNGHNRVDARLTTWPFTAPRIYTTTEQRLFPDAENVDRQRHVPVDADVAGFDEHRAWHERDLPGIAASVAIPNARLDDVWRSITQFLKAGDVLRLRWRADNNTDQLTHLGLHRDELRVGVLRGPQTWEFLLAVSVADTTHRMVLRCDGA